MRGKDNGKRAAVHELRRQNLIGIGIAPMIERTAGLEVLENENADIYAPIMMFGDAFEDRAAD